eukprot:SAG22_NODE_5408_length_1020_cov_1.030402_1_plen_38_part_10
MLEGLGTASWADDYRALQGGSDAALLQREGRHSVVHRR